MTPPPWPPSCAAGATSPPPELQFPGRTRLRPLGGEDLLVLDQRDFPGEKHCSPKMKVWMQASISK
jgi:hypothetical protein